MIGSVSCGKILIVEEIHTICEEIAKEYDYDLNRIVNHLMKKEMEHTGRVIHKEELTRSEIKTLAKRLQCMNHSIQLEAPEMKNLHLPIIIEMDEDGYYIASCPLFKGCHSYGETIDEALKNIREVIDICLEETEVKELNKFVGFRELQVVRNT